eukprot:TRINITY_DN9713_c0_g1_i1.p1 TRINITY_DN9713_c0_g1~~TRINITY_DN9713_c0_g1_i1.p1  ORF type:complete len:506 (+),score=104.95 TRINITY_DN9713_c0_g1_i1:154-1671(+)
MDRRRHHDRPLYQIDPKPVHHKRERERGGKVHLVNADSLVSMVQEMCSEVSSHSQRLNRLEMKLNDTLNDMESEVITNTNTKIEALSIKMQHWEQQLRQTSTTSLLHAKQLQGKIDQLSYEISSTPNKMADSYSGIHEQSDDGNSSKQFDRLFAFCKLIQRDILDIANEQSRISDVNTQLESDIQTVRIHLDSLSTSPTGVGLSANTLRDLEERLARIEAKHTHRHHRPHHAHSQLSLKKQPIKQQLPPEPTLSSVLDMLDDDDQVSHTPPEVISQVMNAAKVKPLNTITQPVAADPGIHHQSRRVSGTSSIISRSKGSAKDEVMMTVPQSQKVEQPQQPQQKPKPQPQQREVYESRVSDKKTDAGSASSLSTAVPNVADVTEITDKSQSNLPANDDDNDSSHRRKLEIEALLNQARADRTAKAEPSSKEQQALDSLGLAPIPEGESDDDTTSLPGIQEIESITPVRSNTSTRRRSLSPGIGQSPSPQFVDLDDSDSDSLTLTDN